MLKSVKAIYAQYLDEAHKPYFCSSRIYELCSLL